MSYIVFSIILLVLGISGVWFGPRIAHSGLERLISPGSKIVLFIGVPLFGIWNAVYQIPAGHVGLMYRFADIVGQTGEGLQWTWPWQDIAPASFQVQNHPFPKLDSFSFETQDVFVAATVNVRVSPEDIQGLYRTVGKDYFRILVAPRVNQYFKDETVKYKAVEVAPNREVIRKAVRERLTNELKERSIIVDDLLIDNISFKPEFQASIENKQIQAQNALAEKEKVAGEEQKANQAIEQARGRAESVLVEAKKQAEANRELSASITPELVQYLMVQKLAPNVNVMMIPTGQQFIFSPDVLKGQAHQR